MTRRLWVVLTVNAAGWGLVIVRASLPGTAFMLAASLFLVWAIIERHNRR
jgi:hypothetical protein